MKTCSVQLIDPSMTRFTHAIVIRVPNSIKLEDKKLHVDLALARKQQEDLVETLREAGVDVVQLHCEDDVIPSNLHIDDVAVVINGTALITRPKKATTINSQLLDVLRDLAWQILESPANEHGKPVILEGSDVLFTGREIFVGIRKGGTNIEGAMVIGRTFADLAVVPVHISGHLPLKHYVSVIAPDVLGVANNKDAAQVVQRLEREATFRYKILTMTHEEAVACINVNDHLIFRQDTPETKFQVLHEPLQLWGVTVSELVKLGDPISKFVLLVKNIKDAKNVW